MDLLGAKLGTRMGELNVSIQSHVHPSSSNPSYILTLKHT